MNKENQEFVELLKEALVKIKETQELSLRALEKVKEVTEKTILFNKQHENN